MMKKSFCISVFFLTIALVSGAYAIHKGAGGLVCGQCHTMHNSQGSTNLGGASPSGSIILLRGNVGSRAEVHKFCLQCHASNGIWANVGQPPHGQQAPKVYSDATWDWNQPFKDIGAGGNFSTELSSTWDATTPHMLGTGHSLGITAAENVTPPGGDQPIGDFSCTNCHDPHGTSNPNHSYINMFRNLKVYPSQAGQRRGVVLQTTNSQSWKNNKSYVGGVSQYSANGAYFGGNELDNAGNVIWPVYTEQWGTLSGVPNSDDGKTNSYASGADTADPIPAVGTISRWCAQCHDRWHEAIEPSNTAHFLASGNPDNELDSRRHMVNAMIPRRATAGCAVGCHISLLDRVNYNVPLIQSGMGIPVTTSYYYTGNVYYLPWEDPGTCGTNPNIGCMDNPSSDKDRNHKVFCLTCHFAHGGPYNDNLRWNYTSAVSSGGQAGNVIPSNKGCQLCHNRGG